MRRVGGPRAQQYKSARDALGDTPRSFERKVNDFQRSLAFYNRTMALGQDLQVEVAVYGMGVEYDDVDVGVLVGGRMLLRGIANASRLRFAAANCAN